MDVDEQEFDVDFSWRDGPEMLADRLGVTPAAIVAGAVMIAAAGWGAWLALRPPAVAVEQVLPQVGAVEIPIDVTTTEKPVAVVLVVHVDGAVVNPGVHEVAAGSRVVDAVVAAGGLRSDADRSRLNLARPVEDGQRIWVPIIGEQEPAVVLPTGGSGDAAGSTVSGSGGAATVNVNQADAGRLEALSGIGPSLAAAIVRYREENGPFATVDGLQAVPGIGPAKLAQLRDQVAL